MHITNEDPADRRLSVGWYYTIGVGKVQIGQNRNYEDSRGVSDRRPRWDQVVDETMKAEI